MTSVSIGIVTRGRRITANLAEQLLEDGMEVTGSGIAAPGPGGLTDAGKPRP